MLSLTAIGVRLSLILFTGGVLKAGRKKEISIHQHECAAGRCDITSYCRYHHANGSVQSKCYFSWSQMSWILHRAPSFSFFFFSFYITKPTGIPSTVMKSESNCCKRPLKNHEKRQKEIQEVTASLTVAKESELGNVFTLKEERRASLKAFGDVKDDFSFGKSLVKHRGGAPLIMLPAGSTLDVVDRSSLQSPSCFFLLPSSFQMFSTGSHI